MQFTVLYSSNHRGFIVSIEKYSIKQESVKKKKKPEDIILSQKFAKILRSEILKLFFGKMWFKQKNESIKQKIMMKIIGRQDKYFE